MDGKKVLTMEVADRPEDQAQNDAEKQRGGERKGDGPASAPPGEVAGKAAQRDVESSKDNEGDTDNDEEKAEEDENAAEIGHFFLKNTWAECVPIRSKRCLSMAFASRIRSAGRQGLVRRASGRWRSREWP